MLGPQQGNFKTVLDSLEDLVSEGLGTEYEITMEAKKVDRFTGYRSFKRRLESGQPDIVVLMDNRTIDLYKQYQQENRGKVSFPPTIVCMAVFVEESIIGLEKVMGVNYEVPIVTTVGRLRSHVNLPIKRIGVLYRNVPGFRYFLDRQQEFTDRENFQLVTLGIEPVQDSSDWAEQVVKGLRFLIHEEQVDAIWALNDSTLINDNPRIQSAWLEQLEDFDKPVIVNVENFIDPQFGTYGALPDHEEIAAQVADFIENILNEEVKKDRVEDPRSLRLWVIDKPYLHEKSHNEIEKLIPDKRRRN